MLGVCFLFLQVISQICRLARKQAVYCASLAVVLHCIHPRYCFSIFSRGGHSMVPVSLPKKWQKTTAGIFFGVAFIVLPLLIAACGSTTTTGNGTPTSNALACSTAPNNSAPTPTPYPASSDLTAPTGLITPGTL